jgi:hypothetical protein
MMTLLKLARIHSNPKNSDSWIDGCGYLSCGGELSAEKTKSDSVAFQGGKT